MREILFRGKRKDNGEWFEGYLSETTIISDNTYVAFVIYKKPKGYYDSECSEVIPETVGQYTGSTDKNGKKIFEGDIVEFYINDSIVVGKVFYTEDSTAFEVWYELPEQKLFFLSKTLCDCEGVKVVGNIHDNPELLKEAEQE